MVTAVADEQIVEAIRAVSAGREVRVRVNRPVTGRYLCELGAEFELYRFEAGKEGEIIIAPPPGWRTARIETDLASQVSVSPGARRRGGGYGGNRGYHPLGGRLCIPDVSWVSHETQALFEQLGEPTDGDGFDVLTPDFVIEVRSKSQTVAEQQEKMEDWRAWGVALGLLVEPESQTVYLYRPGQPVAIIDRPETVSCEPEMPGLNLDFSEIWALPWP